MWKEGNSPGVLYFTSWRCSDEDFEEKFMGRATKPSHALPCFKAQASSDLSRGVRDTPQPYRAVVTTVHHVPSIRTERYLPNRRLRPASVHPVAVSSTIQTYTTLLHCSMHVVELTINESLLNSYSPLIVNPGSYLHTYTHLHYLKSKYHLFHSLAHS